MAGTIRSLWIYQPVTLKSGKRGKRQEFVGRHTYCPVEKCERCNRLGSPAWIHNWYMTPWTRFKDELAPEEMEGKLCIGCAAKERRHWQAFHLVRENRTLIRKIRQEASRVHTQNCR